MSDREQKSVHFMLGYLASLPIGTTVTQDDVRTGAARGVTTMYSNTTAGRALKFATEDGIMRKVDRRRWVRVFSAPALAPATRLIPEVSDRDLLETIARQVDILVSLAGLNQKVS